MSITVNFAGASLVSPGSYTETEIAQSGVSAPTLGVVAIIGESDEGPAFSAEKGLSSVTFGPDEFQAIAAKYGSGELLDAARIAISPSNDPQIKGGAQQLVIIKTNNSVKASLSIPQSASSYGTLKAVRAGAPGNKVSYACAIVSLKAVITLERLDTGVKEVSAPLGGNAVMSITCTEAATSAKVNITATHFTTTIVGGTIAQSLSLELKHFPIVKQLVEFINSQPGYTASSASAIMATKSSSELDQVVNVSILTSASIKKDAAEVRAFFASSHLVSFTPAIFVGLPTVKAKTYLTAGVKGATLASDVLDSIDALLKKRVNFIVPLFSRDAAYDIADGLTDPNSTYDIDAIHQAIASHCNQASTVKGRKERQGFCAFKGTYDDTEEKSAILSAARVQLCFQDVDVVSASTGLIENKQPHMLAVISACMKASAPVGLPNLFKAPMIAGFSHSEFDPETQSDKAITANLCFVENAPNGGFRFKIDNSTFSRVDGTEWVNNRPSVLYSADTAAYAIRLSTERFVGQRNSDVSEETVKNLMVTIMDSLKSAGIIVASQANPKGYKDLTVKLRGSIIEIGVTLILVEGIEFVLSSIKVQRAG